MTNRNRRSFVSTVAATGTLGLAGCLSQLEEWRGGNGSQNPSNKDPKEPSDNGSKLPGESIDGFESLDEWSAMIDAGTLEARTDDPYAGSQSAHLTASEGTEAASIYKSIPDGMDLSGKNVSVAVKFTGRRQLRLTLELFAPNSRNAHVLQRTLIGPSDRWVRVDFGIGRIETQPDLADVRQIRLAARRRNDQSGPIDCQVDDLRVVDRPQTGKVMLLFDGILESHYTNAYEKMKGYEFPGVESVIPAAIGEDGRLTIDKLEELNDAGWDMAARPRTGSKFLHEFSPDMQKGKIERTKKHLEKLGFEDGAKHFITPRNILSPTARDLVEEYHEQAFRFGGAPNALPLTDPYNVGFFSGAAGEETKRYVDYAANYGQLAVLQFTYIDTEDGISGDAFKNVLEYIDGKDVEVVSATELLES
ncbi:polysaccharide deacetylase family protein [Natrinema halophilum]|uniref:Polysaccharide deacetylase n=1 Tax=Natrinema halophilum TaxID=1699371 RepID=A0A7D5GJM2_9EURY|nr:hypothetical protein [Natrinema halophilum]QLG50754.1 hypothetical protein HYG82_18885 [Natrinema halophilum]